MIKKLLLYVPGLLFLVPLLFPSDEIRILPFEGERPCRLQTYIDNGDTTGGSMGFLSDTTDSMIVFNFTLDTVNHDKNFSPISGFNIIFDKYSTGEYLDLREYDYLDIRISMRESFSFILYMKTFEYFTDTMYWWSQRYTETIEEVEPRGSTFRFEFRKFKTPQWWIEEIGKERWKNLPPVPDYSRVMGIDFQNRPGMNKLHVPERMEITEITFRKSRKMRMWLCVGGCVVWLLCVTLLYILTFARKQREEEHETGMPGRNDAAAGQQPHIELRRRDEEDTDRLTDYLKKNYQNPELSSDVVYGETGISPERISGLLKHRFAKSFREYLNFLRIEEAKYQLLKTDRTIAEIAFAVGYNSIPHFNRVFKSAIGTPPKEFRENGDMQRI